MCNVECILFVAKNLSAKEVKNKKVIEIGAYNVNGSVRAFVEGLKPSKYVGVDIKKGPGVGIICNIENLVDRFGENSFDIAICTETLEHVFDWKKAIFNLKHIVKKGGIIFITTRSRGFPYHAYPYDFWRFEKNDMRSIFSDFEGLILEADKKDSPGVFLKARKPKHFAEKDIGNIELYNIVMDKRIKNADKNLRNWKIDAKEKFKRGILGLWAFFTNL